MGLTSVAVVTLTVTCDNCGDSIYQGPSDAFDPRTTFSALMSGSLGEPPMIPQVLCVGGTCTHNCADALRTAFNGLAGRTAPALAPFPVANTPTTA
jgi:hypothetical protein